MKKKKLIAFHIDREMYEKLIKEAKKEKRDLSKQLRYIISNYYGNK